MMPSAVESRLAVAVRQDETKVDQELARRRVLAARVARLATIDPDGRPLWGHAPIDVKRLGRASLRSA
jgi:hypothetical protein